MTRKFKRDLAALEEIFDFIDGFVKRSKIDPSLVFTLHLVVEELFTNMVKYNQGNPNEIEIDLHKEDGLLRIRLIDFDVDPFDITQTGNVDINEHLEKRKVGGLGIHLVKQMMDDIDYHYENRTSTITLTKHLEKGHV